MSGVRIEMLPAEHGDCLLVHYGPAGDRARLLVDGGPATAYRAIREQLDASLGSDRSIDLFVVTHVDTDHVEGALMLLADNALGLDFGDIWFNSYEHLRADRIDAERGGVQGEYLASLLDGKSWNRATDGESIRVWDGGEPMMLAGPDGTDERFTIISPTSETARRMATKWKEACDEAGIPLGDVQRVLDRLEHDPRYDLDRGVSEPRATLGADRTAPNGSSIAMLFETGAQRILLTGDAHARVLEQGLRKVSLAHDESPLRVDAFKLSHHGSRGNITAGLLELVDCELFLVSTDGSHFGHPHDDTIELIAAKKPGATVCFNYRTEHTEPWADDTRIITTYGSDGHLVVDLPAS
jgi:beta-lactamase superfamily II metal-dependent hydrolase